MASAVLCGNAWTKSLKNLPRFDRSFINNWLNSIDKLPRKVKTRGYSNFCEGYVFDVEVKVEDQSIVKVRARSYRSQRKNEDPWRLQVELTSVPACSVIGQHCSCETGAGVCNHVIGLMYLLEHYMTFDLKSVPPAMSKTSLPQTWHVPQRTSGINPREIDDVVVQQIKPPDDQGVRKKIRRVDGVRSTLYNPIGDSLGNQDILTSFREHFADHKDVQINSIIPNIEDISFTKCKLGDVAVGSILSYQQHIKDESTKPKVHMNVDGPDSPPPYTMPHIVSRFPDTPTDAQRAFLDGLCISREQAILYEEETRDQSHNKKWHDLRSQRLSSSKFKDVCCRRKDFESLATRLLKKTNQTAAMKHGVETEEEAAASYADYMNYNVFPSGIVINPSAPHLATSPDRRVYDVNEQSLWGLLEVKCPMKESITDLGYLKEVNGTFKLKHTHNYYYQVMGQMLLTGSNWADLYIYCDKDFHIERIYFDSDFSDKILAKLDSFYFLYLLSQLMKS